MQLEVAVVIGVVVTGCAHRLGHEAPLHCEPERTIDGGGPDLVAEATHFLVESAQGLDVESVVSGAALPSGCSIFAVRTHGPCLIREVVFDIAGIARTLGAPPWIVMTPFGTDDLQRWNVRATDTCGHVTGRTFLVLEHRDI